MTRIAARALPLALMLSLAGAAAAQAGERGVIAGVARAVDGDSLVVAGALVRLHGIDAFERGQTCRRADNAVWPCGLAAASRLARLAGGRTVLCRVRDRDRYGRPVAVCTTGGRDLGRAMVAAGLALAYRRYADDYAAVEAEARDAKRGAWEGSFAPPWRWRRAPDRGPGRARR